MAYVLNQFNQPRTDETAVTTAANLTYMQVITGGTVRRRKNASDSGVIGTSLDPFYDECVQFDSPLAAGSNYYFHARIKRLSSDQVFYVYLVNYEETGIDEDVKTQYLKTITVQGGGEGEWVDFELIFTPLIQFDCLLFQLQRTIEDYREGTRYPTIVYEELSIVKNMISSKIKQGIGLIKMGVQSHPGLMMCINGEEIHIGRTGTYEVRNGIITVEFFSVVEAAVENINGTNPLRVNGNKVTITEYLDYLANLPTVTSATATNSKCIFSNSKLRSIDAFTLDYMYEEE